MLDQSFSASNFNILFLKQNRKGNIKKKYLSREYFNKHEEFKSVLLEKTVLKSSKADKKLTKEEMDFYAEILETINIEKEDIRNNLFFEYSKQINSEEIPFNCKLGC